LKPSLRFVTHSFHAQTKSCEFLREVLAERYTVTTLWDDGWQAGGRSPTAAEIEAGNPDVLLFFQRLPDRKMLRQLRCRNRLWAPMRDDLRLDPEEHRKLRSAGLKILNFCEEAHHFFIAQGFRSHGLRYMPEPLVRHVATGDPAPPLFFWQRHAQPGWPELRAVLGGFRPSEIILRMAADPGQTLLPPPSQEVADYRIKCVEGWLERADYEALLARCGLFFAPRNSEGIGMAMLEAMGRGQAVIAPNAATMNEYICHGVNGYLYDLASPAAIDFSNLAAVRRQALANAWLGREQWLASIPGLFEFIAEPAPKPGLLWRLRGVFGR
jgi:Glycosyl transferases group 1